MTQIPASLPLQERAVLAVLDAVAQAPDLIGAYVLKGGLALRYAYGSPRKSSDIDFTAVESYSREVTPEKTQVLHAFCERLNEVLAAVAAAHGFGALRVYWTQTTDELPVLLARIGYSERPLPGDAFEQYVEMQVTLSEEVFGRRPAEVYGIPLNVPNLEGIVAEKLKAYLQQLPRDTSRPRDLFDLWYFTSQSTEPLDRQRVAEYLLRKAEKWPEILPVTKARFRDERLRERAGRAFDVVKESLSDPSLMPRFEDAHAAVMAFVEGLSLPH